MIWRQHTVKPTGPEAALIAVFDDENRPFLLPEIYRWDVARACWMGEANALLLKHREFLWVPETNILETLP